VLARAKAAGVELESKLTAAQNQEARARLRALLAAAAAGKFTGNVIQRVFDGE
jgi:hypothetical protein